MATDPMGSIGHDLLDLLRTDHLGIDELFHRFANAATEADKLRIVHGIYLELIPHSLAEEELFYPALRDTGDPEADDSVAEARSEHAAAKKTLQAILRGDPGDLTYDMKVKMLQKSVQHHVREEETTLFQQARDNGLDLVALGERWLRRKAELRDLLERELAQGRIPGAREA